MFELNQVSHVTVFIIKGGLGAYLGNASTHIVEQPFNVKGYFAFVRSVLCMK